MGSVQQHCFLCPADGKLYHRELRKIRLGRHVGRRRWNARCPALQVRALRRCGLEWHRFSAWGLPPLAAGPLRRISVLERYTGDKAGEVVGGCCWGIALGLPGLCGRLRLGGGGFSGRPGNSRQVAGQGIPAALYRRGRAGQEKHQKDPYKDPSQRGWPSETRPGPGAARRCPQPFPVEHP